MLTNYVLLNLLVAVIIDSFVAVSDLNKGVVTPEDIEEFKVVWALHDEDGDAMIRVEALVEVVMELSFPLGISNIPGQSRKSKLRMRKEAEKIILRAGYHQYRRRSELSRYNSCTHGPSNGRRAFSQ